MAARKSTTSTATEQSIDLAALYSDMEVSITEGHTKEFGKYLPFTWYRAEVAEAIKFLAAKHGVVSTSVVRQFVVAIITKKIEALPEGNDKVFDEMGRIREEVTKSELKARLMARLEASKKSSNSGPTVTRSLCSPSNKDWLKKHHGIVCTDGQWGLTVASQDSTATQEEESS